MSILTTKQMPILSQYQMEIIAQQDLQWDSIVLNFGSWFILILIKPLSGENIAFKQNLDTVMVIVTAQMDVIFQLLNLLFDWNNTITFYFIYFKHPYTMLSFTSLATTTSSSTYLPITLTLSNFSSTNSTQNCFYQVLFSKSSSIWSNSIQYFLFFHSRWMDLGFHF